MFPRQWKLSEIAHTFLKQQPQFKKKIVNGIDFSNVFELPFTNLHLFSYNWTLFGIIKFNLFFTRHLLVFERRPKRSRDIYMIPWIVVYWEISAICNSFVKYSLVKLHRLKSTVKDSVCCVGPRLPEASECSPRLRSVFRTVESLSR